MKQDAFGNRILTIGKPTTMFSCHTDTVHFQPGMQKIVYDQSMGLIYKDDKSPLGADDGAGIWILLKLIEARVPGLYIFHRGEEVGGQGSTWISEETPEVVKNIKRAIAFDRRGTEDVITHQSSGRCCSDTFAKALCEALDMTHKPSARGIFTDTANYTHLIPECTNVSVGYYHEHTKDEALDLDYLRELSEKVIEVDWEDLPTTREPVIEVLSSYDLFWDMCFDTPEVAATLLELCNPSQELIDEAYARGKYGSNARYNDRQNFYSPRRDESFGEEDLRFEE